MSNELHDEVWGGPPGLPSGFDAARRQADPQTSWVPRPAPLPDKFHDECGVVAVYGHPEAANLAYLGLYAQQHRGQESAGICTYSGGEIHGHKSMGHVAD